MKPCVSLFVLGMLLHGASAMTHSLRYFYTASSQVPNFPEFVAVGLVDDVQMVHYDSDTQRAVSKQEWMDEATEGDPQYWDRQTQKALVSQQAFKVRIEIAKQRMNQTGGTHILQLMYGCEWNEETGEVKGYYQDGFDGEDFIVFDLETGTWIAPRQEAFISKLKWDKNEGRNAYYKNYFTQICPDWLKKYVSFGKQTLMRTELPNISLLQKSSSSPVTCHATGFYPDRAMLFWTKDGHEFYEGVEPGEILPNGDGTFQKSVELDVSSIPSADWDKYHCVFKLSGVPDDILTKLDQAVIRTNEKSINIIAIVLGVLAGVGVLAVIILLFFLLTKKNAKRTPSSVSESEVRVLNPIS